MAADNVVKNAVEATAGLRQVTAAFKELSNAGKDTNRALSDTNDTFGSLRREAKEAMEGSQGLSDVIRAMGGQGEVTTKSFKDLASSLPLLATGFGALVIVAGGLIEAMVKNTQQMIAFEAAMDRIPLDDEISMFHDWATNAELAAKATGSADDGLVGATVALSNAQKKAADTSKEFHDKLADLDAAQKAGKLTYDDYSDAAGALIAKYNGPGGLIESAEHRARVLRDELDAQRQLNAAVRDEMQSGAADTANALSHVMDMFSATGSTGVGATANGYMQIVGSVNQTSTAFKGLGEQSVQAFTEAQAQTEEFAGFLANGFGPVATGVFDAYTAALYNMMHAHKESTAGIIKALGEQVKASIKSIGEDAAVHALYELAMGLAASAVGDPRAGLHYTAAEEFGITAAAAGLASAAIGGGGGGAYSGAGPSGGGSGTSSGPMIVQQITVIGTLDDRDATSLQQQLARASANQDLAQ